MNQYGKAEWDRLSEQERQNQLAKMRMLEKKLRREGKYDELAKLLGDAALQSDALGVCCIFCLFIKTFADIQNLNSNNTYTINYIQQYG